MYGTKTGAIAPEIGTFSSRLSATKRLSRAKMRRHL